MIIIGCDGSVLLDSPTNQSEKFAPPNLSLRGFNIIDRVKLALENACPGVVSCADIVVLVARDVTVATKGPFWEVETRRRDRNVSLISDPLNPAIGLPQFFANINLLKQSFALRGLNTKDIVVLSGGHTIRMSHCSSFDSRLYNFTGKGDTDPSVGPFFSKDLLRNLIMFITNTVMSAEST
ncbi:putative peroxidase [Helianthus anomalus]